MRRSPPSLEATTAFSVLGGTKEKVRAFVSPSAHLTYFFLEISEEGSAHLQIRAAPYSLDLLPETQVVRARACVCTWVWRALPVCKGLGTQGTRPARPAVRSLSARAQHQLLHTAERACGGAELTCTRPVSQDGR